jgi:di/tricarboxylate transporter
MASKATDKRDFEEAKQTEDPNQPDAADTISSVLHECENLRLQIIQMVRKYPISVTSALLGWTGLLVLNALAEVCTASPDEMDMCLDWKSYWTLALLLGALLLMMNDAAPDLVMLGFTVVLVLSKVINDSEAWAGCSSPSVLSIGALFIVARALEETRVVETIMLPLLGRPSTHWSALLRMCAPIMVFSMFLNNTPIVAMMIPLCETWAAASNLSVRVLLMPLSFASMLGGMCTLIGTSTNLVLNSQIESDADAPLDPLTMFSMTAVGIPSAIVGLLYLAFVVPLALQPKPEAGEDALDKPAAEFKAVLEEDSLSQFSGSSGLTTRASSRLRSRNNRRSNPMYNLEVLVTPECERLIGTPPSLLPDLISPACHARLLIRGDSTHPAEGYGLECDLVIQAGDRLLIACLAESIAALRSVAGLNLRPDLPDTDAAARHHHAAVFLVEAAVAGASPLVGMSVAEVSSTVFGGADVWAVRQRVLGSGLAGNVVTQVSKAVGRHSPKLPSIDRGMFSSRASIDRDRARRNGSEGSKAKTNGKTSLSSSLSQGLLSSMCVETLACVCALRRPHCGHERPRVCVFVCVYVCVYVCLCVSCVCVSLCVSLSMPVSVSVSVSVCGRLVYGSIDALHSAGPLSAVPAPSPQPSRANTTTCFFRFAASRAVRSSRATLSCSKHQTTGCRPTHSHTISRVSAASPSTDVLQRRSPALPTGRSRHCASASSSVPRSRASS